MNQNLGTFDVLQELEAQAQTFAGTFDDTCDVSHNKACVMELYHAQVRVDGCEVVVCNLRLCAGRNGQQRRLTYVRETNQTNVCDQLHFQNNSTFLASSARFRKVWSLTHGVLEVNVTAAASSALRSYERITIFNQVLHQMTGFFVDYHGTYRNLDNQVFAGLTKTLLLHTVLAIFRFVFSLELKVHQGSQVSVSLENNVSASSAVTAIRTAFRYERFTTECYSTIAALTGLNKNFGSIYKHFQNLPYIHGSRCTAETIPGTKITARTKRPCEHTSTGSNHSN